ncbi:ras-related and estrogen-regulated growth inhibitor-like protein [Salmo trutta]|uniref:ras-related and estrogen-regulated growth inhibitor-like protein n=1 Tax=Salmo trutta TaxID=8032 RepID=UPI00113154E7|nr:ras-related and estrogen-regulated growth inhibitor-like protein [Salmo trutta]
MTGLNALKLDANVVVLGKDRVGKSALTVCFLSRRFIGEYGNIESIYSHNVVMDGRDITFNIWDSPCCQDLSIETSPYEKKVQWANGFVLVYSICDRASFNSVTKLIQSIKDFQGMVKVPMVIVDNKRDLNHRWTVLSEEGRMLTLTIDCQFYVVSAAENYYSVLMVFHGLIDRIWESKSAIKKQAGIKDIVKSMSAVFARRRTDSL